MKQVINVNGIELNEYLSKQKLTPQISNKLIELYEAMVKVGYLRQLETIGYKEMLKA